LGLKKPKTSLKARPSRLKKAFQKKMPQKLRNKSLPPAVRLKFSKQFVQVSGNGNLQDSLFSLNHSSFRLG
jgi:hypothetical protein